MKKAIVITILIGLFSFGASAQKITFGGKIAAGFGYQQIKGLDILSTSSVKTFNIKGIAQRPVGKDFWLEGSLGIANKGSVVFNDALTTTTHVTYGELTLNVLRKYRFTDLGVFYAGAGGYLARGLSGSLDYETPGSNTADKLIFGEEADLRRFDAGLNFTAGFEFRNRVTFNMGYSLGLNNIASEPQQDSGTSVIKNREFTIGLGYLFK